MSGLLISRFTLFTRPRRVGSMSITELLQPPVELAPLERLITPDDVGGRAAWHVLARDGAIQPLFGEAALATGVSDSLELRAEAVRLASPEQVSAAHRPLVVGSLGAAWIWLGGTPPAEIEYLSSDGRIRTTAFAIRMSPYLTSHICQISGVWLTNKERTIRDLALWCEAEVALPLILRLLAIGANLNQTLLMLERPMRLVNRPAARQTLELAAKAVRE